MSKIKRKIGSNENASDLVATPLEERIRLALLYSNEHMNTIVELDDKRSVCAIPL